MRAMSRTNGRPKAMPRMCVSNAARLCFAFRQPSADFLAADPKILHSFADERSPDCCVGFGRELHDRFASWQTLKPTSSSLYVKLKPDSLEETTMAENQSSQTEATAARKGSSDGNGGAQRNQPVAQRTEQSRGVAVQSSGREGRTLTSAGSRQLTSAAQNPFTMMRQLSREMDRLMDSFFE